MIQARGTDTSAISSSVVGVMTRKADQALQLAKEERANAEFRARQAIIQARSDRQHEQAMELQNLKNKGGTAVARENRKAEEAKASGVIATAQARVDVAKEGTKKAKVIQKGLNARAGVGGN